MFKFNTRGKLTDQEAKEPKRTNKNIFSWRKPKNPVIRRMEPEVQEEAEDKEIVERDREERLERVRRRRIKWQKNKT